MNIRIYEIESEKLMQNGENNANVKEVPPKLPPVLGKNGDKIIVTWNPGNINAAKDVTDRKEKGKITMDCCQCQGIETKFDK